MNHIFRLLLVMWCVTTAAGQGVGMPSAFDLRDIDGHSYIGAIRDQGNCGSCYSFGALAAAESAWNRAHNLYDDRAVDLSEAFVVWNLSPLYDGMSGCDGAYLQDTMDAIVDYGAPLEADFPYTITDPGDNLHWDAPRHTFQSWYAIPTNDVETTKRVLRSIGAVMVGVNVNLEDRRFYDYEGGIFDDPYQVPEYLDLSGYLNHAVALVGWNDDPGDDGMGFWILRNSWGAEDWGENGYMRIRYLAAGVNLIGEYLIAEPWDGESVTLENNGVIDAVPWQSGGTLNAHGVDLWGGAASYVANDGSISAEALASDELATARGVYLWGGPEGSVVNAGDIAGRASSESSQAIAYAICVQGGRVENRGQLTAEAQSLSDMALAFGVWASNGTNPLEISNRGDILARANSSDAGLAYGLWAVNRDSIAVTNTGVISADANDRAMGVYLAGGPVYLENSGTIVGQAEDSGCGGFVNGGSALLKNRGVIRGNQYSIRSWDNVVGVERCNVILLLETGSNLIGPVKLEGAADRLVLTGNGSEDEIFYGVESLTLADGDWSLSGDSSFGAIYVNQGRLGIDGVLAGDASVAADGILGGSGTLTGDVANAGTVAPGHSIDHLTIDGDFTQDADGTLEIEIGDGTADRLTVTGTANLAGTLLVVPDGYATGGSYTFLDANGVNGTFDSLQSAAVLHAELSGGASGSLGLDVTRNSYASLAAVHNLGLAGTLDVLRPTAEGNFADLLDRLDQALSTSQLNGYLSELTPRIHGLATTLALEDGQAGFDGLRRRMDQIDRAGIADPESEDKTAFWVETPAYHTRYGSDGSYPDVHKTLYGLMVGLERGVYDGLRLGAAAVGTESHYEADNSDDKGENETLRAVLYGVWSDPQRSGGWRLGAALGAGVAELEADRSISFATRRAHSEHDGRILDAGFHGGYDWTRGNWILGPTFGFTWVQLREEGFHESGADAADLAIHSRESDSFRGVLGGRLARELTWRRTILEPELRAQWLHEFSRNTSDLKATLAAGGEGFTTSGHDLARDSLILGVGLNARLSEAISASLRYDCMLQSDSGATDHALHLDAGLAF